MYYMFINSLCSVRSATHMASAHRSRSFSEEEVMLDHTAIAPPTLHLHSELIIVLINDSTFIPLQNQLLIMPGACIL